MKWKDQYFKLCIFFFVNILVWAFSLSGFAQSSVRLAAINSVQEGDNLMQRGMFREALVRYNEAITTDPGFADAYMKKALYLSKTNQNTEAQLLYNQAIEMNPYSVYQYDPNSRLSMSVIDYKDIILFLNEVEEVATNDDFASEKNTLIWITLEYYASHIFKLNDQIEDLPEESARLIINIISNLKNDNIEKAEANIASLEEKHPTSVLLLEVKGLMELMKDNYPQAQVYFEKAQSVDPNFAMSYYNKALAREIHKEYNQAINDIELALKLDPQLAEAYYLKGIAEKNSQKLEASVDNFKKAVELNPKLTSAYINKGIVEILIRDYNNALIDIDYAIEYNKKNSFYYNLRGCLNNYLGDYDKAVDDYNDAIAIDRSYAAAYFNRGMAQVMRYANEAGCKDLQHSLDLGIIIAGDRIKYFCGEY